MHCVSRFCRPEAFALPLAQLPLGGYTICFEDLLLLGPVHLVVLGLVGARFLRLLQAPGGADVDAPGAMAKVCPGAAGPRRPHRSSKAPTDAAGGFRENRRPTATEARGQREVRQTGNRRRGWPRLLNPRSDCTGPKAGGVAH